MEKGETKFSFLKLFSFRKVSFPLVIICAGIIAFFTVSCEIGLGPAVDTLAPTLTIEYPPTNAVVRSTFMLSGTCDDDDGVASVQVSLRNTTTEENFGPYNASISGDAKTWSIELNKAIYGGGYNGWEIPDGSYTISVTVFDGVGRSAGPFSRSLDIDNTAPIFIISSPTTDSSENGISRYGTTLRVSGTVAESHDVSQMVLTVYDPKGQSVTNPLELSLENVDVSDGASVDFARYQIAKKDEDSGLTKDYQNVYGTVKLNNSSNSIDTSQNTTQEFSASILISDSAKVYNPSSTDENPNVGNTTTVVYLSSEVYAKTLGSVSADELIACVNGTYKEVTSLGDETATSILTTLFGDGNSNGGAKNTMENSAKLHFSLNPGARPTYEISSLNNLSQANVIDSITNASSLSSIIASSAISASVSASNESKNNINVSSLKMVYYNLGKFSTSLTSITKSSLEEKLEALENTYYSESKTYPSGWTEIGKGSNSASSSSAVFTGKPSDVAGATYYLVAVLGEDVSGTPLYHDQIYVFQGQAYTTPPSISMDADKPETGKYYNQVGNIKIAGEASSGGNNIQSVKIEVTAKDADTGKETTYSKIYTYQKNKRKENFPSTGSLTLADILDSNNATTANNGKNITYTIKATATDSENITSSITRTVYLDSKKPEVTIKAPSPVVTTYDASSNIYVNGKITMDITADDKNLSDVRYKLLIGETKAKIYDTQGSELTLDSEGYLSLGNSSTATISIDTTKYENNKTLKLSLIAEDTAGNKCTEVSSNEYVIKQESDKPVIEVRNANQSLGKINPLDLNTLDETNLFDLSTKKALQVQLSDDDYLSKVQMKIYSATSEGTYTQEVSSQTSWSENPSSKKSLSFKPSLETLTEGIYKVEISVEDETYNSASDDFKTYRKTSVEFWIEVDKENPTLTETSSVFGSSSSEQLLKEDFTLSGTASDTNALYTSPALESEKDAKINGKGSVTITANGTSVATASISKTWTVDVIGNNSSTQGEWSKTFKTSSQNSSDSSYLADGSYEITVEVKDVAGKTQALLRNVTIDTNKPIFNTSRPANGAETEISINNTEKTTDSENRTWYRSSSLEISGNAYDENGIKSVKYAKITNSNSWDSSTGPNGISDEAWSNLPFEDGSWSGVVSDVKNEETMIALRIEDNAGNVSYKKTGTFYIDTLAPERTTASLTAKIGDELFVDEGSSISKTLLSNKTKDISVTLGLSDVESNEHSGKSDIDTSNVYIDFTKFSGSSLPASDKKVSLIEETDNDGNKTGKYSFSISKEKITNGSVYLRFYDKAGNYTDETLFQVSVDTTPPSAKITEPDSLSRLNGKKEVSGIVSEDNSPAKLILYYSTTEPTAQGSKIPRTDDSSYDDTSLKKLGEITSVSDIYNWTFAGDENSTRPIIDFNKISLVEYKKDSGSKKVYIVPVVYDEAGNCNVYTVNSSTLDATYSYEKGKNFWEYTVDLDTDRPTIKISSLNKNNETIKLDSNASISGSVSDDDESEDAVVEVFIASSKNFATIADSNWETVNGIKKLTDNAKSSGLGGFGGETTFNKESGEWTFKPSDKSDYIEDNQGNVFYTGQKDDSDSTTSEETKTALKMPKVSFNSSVSEDNKSAVTYTSDTKQPEISSITIQWADSSSKTSSYEENGGNSASYNGPDGESTSITAGTRLGGKKRYARFVISSSDAAGIASIKLEFPSAQVFTAQTSPLNSATTDSTLATWTSDYIDLASLNTKDSNGNVTNYYASTVDVKFTVTDQSGLYSNATRTFSVDNKAPLVTVTSPASSTQVTASFDIAGRASDEGGSGLSLVKWMVKPKSLKNASLSNLNDLNSLAEYSGENSWQNFTGSLSTWTLSLTENEAKALDDDSKYAVTKDESSAIEYTAEDGTTIKMGIIYTIPFLVYAEDGVGNYSITEQLIKHNPDATIPTVSFTYPTAEDYDNGYDYITLGGPIRVSGAANDTDGYVQAVFMQIDYSAEESYGTWSKDVIVGEANSTTKLLDLYTITSDLSSYSVTSTPSGWWGIKVDGTSSWSKIINSNGELAPEQTSEGLGTDEERKTRYIRVRACAVDNEGHLGGWSTPMNIVLDNQAPKIGASLKGLFKFSEALSSVTLSKFGDNVLWNPSATKTATNTYDANMYLRSETNGWYLGLSVEDEYTLNTNNNYADSVQVYRIVDNGSKVLLTGATDSSAGYIYGDLKSDSTLTGANTERLKKRYIFIPVLNGVSNSASTVSYYIVAKDQDNTEHVTEATYTFRVDNTAPTFEKLTDGNDETITALGHENPTIIQNTNNTWVLKGESKESGSGFERMAFYFSRDYGSSNGGVKIFDATVKNRSAAETTAANSSTADGKYDAIAVSSLMECALDSEDIDSSIKLYGKKFTGSSSASPQGVYTFSATGISSDKHIRKGGLIYIDGLYRQITNISENQVTFDSAVEAKNSVEAYFPYAHVIDRSESSDSSGDNDGILETLSSASGTHTFSATLDTHNIPDGFVTLTCFLFDKAGNISAKVVSGEIQNNAPRLAKLHLGTDLNSDGKYGDGEFNSYLAGSLAQNKTDVEAYVQNFDFKTADSVYNYNAAFKVTKALAVVPEFTGGNGSLKVAYLKDASSETSYRKTSEATGSELILQDSSLVTASFDLLYKNGVEGAENQGTTNSLAKFVIDSSKLPDDGSSKAISLTFWDETDGKTQGTDSNYFFVRIQDLEIDQTDDAAPRVVINKFYWNNLKDNSIYGSSSAKTFDNLKGHIELENDWKNASSYDEVATSGEYDGDPKVSGKIVFTGTVYDEHTLKEISFSYGSLSGTLATFTPGSGWETSAKSMTNDGYEFTLKSTLPEESVNDGEYWDNFENNTVYLNQGGHKVYWKLSLDTEKAKSTASADVKLTITASDQSNNFNDVETSTSDTDDSKYHIPTYQTDIVPYITGLTTSLSWENENVPSAYSRTALGNYPVWTTRKQGKGGVNGKALSGQERVTISGFNMNGTSVILPSNSSTTTLTLSEIENSSDSAGRTSYTFDLTKAVTSGELTVKVELFGVESLNNKNNNNSHGIYTGGSFTTEVNAVPSTVKTTAETLDLTGGDYNIYLNFYNRQPNKTNNNILTDDVILDVWDFNTEAAIPTNNSALDVMMKINPSTSANGRIGFAFCNGDAYWAMPNGTSSSYTNWVKTADFFKSTGFAYSSTGESFGVSAGGESGTNYADTFNLYRSSWEYAPNTDKGSLKGTNGNRLECITQKGDKFGNNTTAENLDKDRILNPSLAVNSVKNGNTTIDHIYLAYCDNINGEIRLRYGSGVTKNITSGQFRDRYTEQGNSGTTPKVYSYNTDDFQIIAGSDSSGNKQGLGYAGEFVSIGVTSDNVLVIVWYDETQEKLLYAYNDNVSTITSGVATVATEGNKGWHEPITLLQGGGTYCQIFVDSENKIHIAAHDPDTGLVYFRMDSYSSSANKYIVDSGEGGPGNLSITLDVAKDESGNEIPYIGYWSATPQFPRMAYLAKPECIGNGVNIETGMYTGIWECSLVPKVSKLAAQGDKNDTRNRINIGVWKDSNGTLTYSTTNKSDPATNDSKIETSVANAGSGNCYGNGSKNPVLAYKIIPKNDSGILMNSSGYVETAQKK